MKEEIGIIGNGAVAHTIALLLQFAGHKPRVWARSGEINTDVKINFNSSLYTIDYSSKKNTNSSASNNPSLVFVCTKAFDIKNAIEQSLENFSSGTNFVVIANGWLQDEVDILSQKYSSYHFSLGTCYFGTDRDQENNFNIHTEKPIIFYSGVKILSPYFVCSKNSFQMIAKKFFFNLVLNTMCGAYRIPYNGGVLRFSRELVLITKESYELMSILSKQSIFDSYGQAMNELEEFISKVYANSNSMYVDVLQKRKTETNYLAGKSVGLSGFENLKILHSVILAGTN